MTGDNRKERDALNRLTDLLVEDILNSSDEEIFSELKERKIDPAQNAAATRALFEKSLVATNKKRLAAARAGVAADRALNQVSSLPVDIAEARRSLRRVLDAPSHDQPVTLAARKESELSDADVLSMLENLRELGVIPPTDTGEDA